MDETENTSPATTSLQQLQRQIQAHYDAYQKGDITQHQYLDLIRPLDRQIEGLELSALQRFICDRSITDR